MATNVKFLMGTAAQYSAAVKDAKTFYYVTDESKLYLGTIELSTPAGVSTAIELVNHATKGNEALKSAIDTLNGDVSTSGSVAKAIDDKVKAVLGNDADLTKLTTEAKTLIAAINEIDAAVDTLTTDSKISIETKGTANEGMAKTYVVYQGEKTDANKVAEIDIPKDMVVSSGKVVTLNASEAKAIDDSYTAGKYIELTIANNDGTKLYIPATALVDVYTAAAGASQVQVAIDSATNIVSASIVAGSIGTTELAADAVTNAKLADDAVQTSNIVDKNVIKAKLEDSVQASLDLADSAVQTIAEGSANGTISVDGDNISVHGLGSAAYTNSTAYDTAGSASTAEANAKAYTDDSLTWGTISNS